MVRRLAVIPVMLVVLGGLAGCGGAPSAADSEPGRPAPTASPGTVVPSAVPAPGPATSAPEPTPGSTARVGTTSTVPPLPDPSPGVGPGDDRVFVLGDSVILGARAEVPAALRGWEVTFDAKESRFVTQGIDEMRSAAATRARESTAGTAGRAAPSLRDGLGRVVVVHLCTNYERNGSYAGWITRYMAELGEVDRVVWVTCVEWSPGQVEANEAMRAAVPRYPNAVLADWARYARTPGYSYGDGIHLDGPGRRAIADLVARAVGPAPGTSSSSSTPTTRR